MLHEPPPASPHREPYDAGRSENPDGHLPANLYVPLAGPDHSASATPQPTAPDTAEEPDQLRRYIEDAAHAANELQAALFDLEAELLRLQHIVRRASPAMMQLMQAATEVNAAGLADRR